MPSILPPSSDTQVDDALDTLREFAPPCEYDDHERVKSTEPATWVVVYDRRRMCPCPAPEVKLFCDPCWWYRGSHNGSTRCRSCGRVFERMETILRVERL